MQEFERLKKIIGKEKWNSIDTYIKKERNDLRLDNIIHNRNNWNDFNIWYNENIKEKKVEILNIWESDYDDLRCNANLFHNGIEVANIIASYDKQDLLDFDDNSSSFNDDVVKKAFKSIIYNDLGYYLNLPKISKCSPLLTSIYDSVCESDSTMCHITDDDWNELYSDEYTEDDFLNLKKEIKELGLQEVVSFYDGGYKIIGWGDLETRFNDDRNLIKDMDNIQI